MVLLNRHPGRRASLMLKDGDGVLRAANQPDKPYTFWIGDIIISTAQTTKLRKSNNLFTMIVGLKASPTGIIYNFLRPTQDSKETYGVCLVKVRIVYFLKGIIFYNFLAVNVRAIYMNYTTVCQLMTKHKHALQLLKHLPWNASPTNALSQAYMYDAKHIFFLKTTFNS